MDLVFLNDLVKIPFFGACLLFLDFFDEELRERLERTFVGVIDRLRERDLEPANDLERVLERDLDA